jgi:hypothetical protein
VVPDKAKKEASYRPSAFYWRRAIRGTDDPEKLRNLALSLVAELEVHKEFIRNLGAIPPKDRVHPDEAKEKGWG